MAKNLGRGVSIALYALWINVIPKSVVDSLSKGKKVIPSDQKTSKWWRY
jgi:hypothetical protein